VPKKSFRTALKTADGTKTRCFTVYNIWIRPLIRRFSFVLLSLLYALTTNNALSALHCRSRSITFAAYTELDQDGSSFRAIGLPVITNEDIVLCDAEPSHAGCQEINAIAKTATSVPILDNNPSFVCYQGSHRPIAPLAWITIFVYVIGYPLITLVYVQYTLKRTMMKGSQAAVWTQALANDKLRRSHYIQDGKTVLQRLFRRIRAALCCTGSRYKGQVRGFRDFCTPACLCLGARSERATGRTTHHSANFLKADEKVVTAADIVDKDKDILGNAALAPFTADVYRASIYYQRHIDFAVLLALAALLVFAKRSPGLLLGLTIIVLALTTTFTLIVRPYTTEASFNHSVRAYANLLAMLGAFVTFLSNAPTNPRSPSGAQQSSPMYLGVLSYVLFVCCVGLAVLLLVTFIISLFGGARTEQAAMNTNPHGRDALLSVDHRVQSGRLTGLEFKNPLVPSSSDHSISVLPGVVSKDQVQKGSSIQKKISVRKVSAVEPVYGSTPLGSSYTPPALMFFRKNQLTDTLEVSGTATSRRNIQHMPRAGEQRQAFGATHVARKGAKKRQGRPMNAAGGNPSLETQATFDTLFLAMGSPATDRSGVTSS
jgi:hypothetical protein